MEELQLSHNGISRIEGLETLTRLRILDLGANQITHIEGIHNQKGLVELWVWNCHCHVRVCHVDTHVGHAHGFCMSCDAMVTCHVMSCDVM